MKRCFKKLLTLTLSAAMVLTMSAGAFAAESQTVSAKAAATDVVSTADVFTPSAGTTKVTIDKIKGTAEVTFTTEPSAAQYTKLALLRQSKTDAAKNKAAFTGTVKAAATGTYTSTFTITIPVTSLGKKLPVSLYTDADGWKDLDAQSYLKIKYTPQIVTDLTSAIYYQARTEGTDALCQAAKDGWDALTDAEKEQVTGFGYYLAPDEEKGGYEYFAEDTGDASADDPLNQDGIGNFELLVASFGTSYNDSRILTIGGIESALEKALPSYSIRRGFTSQIIINHIQARDGEAIDNIEQAVERAIANNVKVLVVQPTTLMAGAEYDELKETVNKYKASFRQIVFSEPLCQSDSDKETVAKAVYGAAATGAGFADASAAAESKDTAFVFMGHGTSHEAKVLYTDMQETVSKLGYKNCFIGTVEGLPESTSCESVIAAVKAAGYTKVVLRPLMIVAGDHANNDMAGDDADSWKSMFTAAGINTTAQIEGLGQLEEVQQLFVTKAKAAVSKVVSVKTTTISKLTAGTKKITVKVNKKSGVDGYQVRYSTSKSMIKYSTKSFTAGSKTISNLTKGKTYYVQVRCYKKTDDGRAYSAWSSAKSVKVK